MQNEDELIDQAKAGDKVALALLLQQHYSFLVKYLIKITMNEEVSYDLAQETMVKCIEKIRLYNGKAKFSTWIISIATHLYIDQKRAQKRQLRFQEQEQYLRKLRWQFTQRNEDWTDTMDSLGNMHEGVRVPIILKHYYGYSLEEIAKMLGIPLGTVKSRIHNGLKSLRKELINYE